MVHWKKQCCTFTTVNRNNKPLPPSPAPPHSSNCFNHNTMTQYISICKMFWYWRQHRQQTINNSGLVYAQNCETANPCLHPVKLSVGSLLSTFRAVKAVFVWPLTNAFEAKCTSWNVKVTTSLLSPVIIWPLQSHTLWLLLVNILNTASTFWLEKCRSTTTQPKTVC